MDTYFKTFYQSSAGACQIDTTPPTFSGIATLSPNTDGSLTATWLAGSDLLSPIEYDVFIQNGSAVDLFNPANRVLSKRGLSARIYTLANETPLTALVLYYVGVRARDSSGNQETNIISLSSMSVGVSIGSVSPGDLLSLVQALTMSGLELVSSVDEDIEIIGYLDGDDDLIGTLEEC